MLCPLILTTVSEELEVEELTSFTMSPLEVGHKQSATHIKNIFLVVSLRVCCIKSEREAQIVNE